MRYVNLSSILALRLMAPKVEKRFPSLKTLVDAKLLLPMEVIMILYNMFVKDLYRNF